MSIGIIGRVRRHGPALRNRSALMLAAIVGCAVADAGAQAVPLGAAGSFAVLGGSGVTSTGATIIFGNLGVSPGTGISGFGPGVVTGGAIHVNDALAVQAHADAATAFGVLAGLPLTLELTGQDLGGRTLPPGVYRFSSSAQLTGQLILDGQGQANPRFVFQIGTTLTTATASSIVEINGAGGNVYFQVGSSATLGTGTNFIGTIIAFASDTLTTGVNVNGRVIALSGAVTLDTNHVSIVSLCYANCDNSTAAPVLNVFICFLNRFASGDSYANCDNSTMAPVLNVLDFACFLNRFAAGCP